MPDKKQSANGTDARTQEAGALAQLRQDYEAQGFDILAALPVSNDGELNAYEPDLIARKGSELIVVEVKRSVEARDTPHLRYLRDRIEQHPGWHFRLVLLGDPNQIGPIEMPARRKTTVDFERSFNHAHKSLEQGFIEGALTSLWIALEGALRAHLARGGESPNPGVTALSMLRRLRDTGEISEEEYQTLSAGYAYRNEAIHGYKPQISKTVLAQMFKVVEELINRLVHEKA